MGVRAASVLLLLLIAAQIPPARGEPRSRYHLTSSFTVENRGSGPFNLTEEAVAVPLFWNDTWQTVRVVNSSVSLARGNIDVDGNRLAIPGLPTMMPPGASLSFSVTYEIEVTGRQRPLIEPSKAGPSSDIPRRLLEESGGETEVFSTGDPRIRELARRVVANETTVLGMVLRLLAWIIENTTYDSLEVPRYPAETLAEGRGDCDDQAILLATMSRAVGIPALLQVGIVFDEGLEGDETSWGGRLRTMQRGVGWHGWVLLYIPPWGWLPVDLTMVGTRDPMSRLTEAPEYAGSIVAALNVSRQDYVGGARRLRDRLMSGDVYVTASDAGITVAPAAAETPWPYDAILLAAGSAAVAAVTLWRERRSRRPEEERI